MKAPKLPAQKPMPGWNEAALCSPSWLGEQGYGPAKAGWAGPGGFSHRYLKRAADILIAVSALLFILSWLLPLLCLLILLDIGAPVFFIQKRIGRYGRPFHCIKLRTMRIEEKAEEQPTRLGHWLRCHKLDETPQFINVLKGEMSIVGPRPHMLSDHLSFSRELGGAYKLRHTVLPGITGLAQVKGYEGPITSSHKLRGRIRLDLFYIRHWSMALEFGIMCRTAQLFVRGMLKGVRRSTEERTG